VIKDLRRLTPARFIGVFTVTLKVMVVDLPFGRLNPVAGPVPLNRESAAAEKHRRGGGQF